MHLLFGFVQRQWSWVFFSLRNTSFSEKWVRPVQSALAKQTFSEASENRFHVSIPFTVFTKRLSHVSCHYSLMSNLSPERPLPVSHLRKLELKVDVLGP